MSRQNETIYCAKYVLLDGRFEDDVALVVSDGMIDEILRNEKVKQRVDANSRIIDLGDVAVMPGQHNVHSHAFQRRLRGRTEYRQRFDGNDDFWTWRTEMYKLANSIDPDEMETIARLAFLEMARAGITHVGEFHYVHHRPDGSLYDNPNELALRIAKAADDIGLRITLLPVAYHTGDIGEPARKNQRRFITDDVETYLERVDSLSHQGASFSHFNLGLAPHSIRAVPRDWMEAIADYGKSHSMPVHIHVCEQQKEVETSRKFYGAPPIEALHDWGVLDETWTLIHGTHLSEKELEILGDTRPTIGACPTTERNLGDGFLPARELVKRDVPIALGSDSHTIIHPFEEMRLVEYHERLRFEERNVLVAVDPRDRSETAQILWPMGTTFGARSLQSQGGKLYAGGPADFVAVELDHPSIIGASQETLLTDIVLSMSYAAVRDVVVAGESIIAERHHRLEHEIGENYRALTSSPS